MKKSELVKIIKEELKSVLTESKDYPVLPLGDVNLSTGKCKFFNVYTTWDNKGTVELYKVQNGPWADDNDPEYRIVFTSGTKPVNSKVGAIYTYKHDQNGRDLFRGILVDTIPLSKLKNWTSKYNVNSLKGYVYK